ncbi:MAG TPA: SAM-dependent methyltransferase [Myxococcales bacterium]|nr:SAM-dependent methyltransferase [Myxococcales bacterium]HBU47818.1 SAM-dependent methyltransferase [Myxococcales bacterium]|tara:strand:- start:51 stop:998 length:948 start_codon:yes stop_codon:yes gene_type:complete
MSKRGKTGTQTQAFGTSKREGHDASAFYKRFEPPVLSNDETVAVSPLRNTLICGDSSDMEQVPDNSVALVVTSPPYFVGKEYEAELGQGKVPASYIDYLHMLHSVFQECARVLEPGGRIAVNVANLGRKPYRSLSADVIRLLEGELGLLLRAEIIWQKGKGATGSCAWGSFQSASNPVLRDLSERIVVASKGRFNRALSKKKRQSRGLPFEDTISKEAFMRDTLDVWSFAPESARRVGHPAPFPLELPTRLIELYTYKGDLVLDPFLGSGSTALAALQLQRDYIGFDLDPGYLRLAEERLQEARDGQSQTNLPGL